jgi:dolichyl-phosphate beta-glucosyltransferase
MPDLSIVIPTFNEEKRLPSSLLSVYDYLKDSGKTFEILIVDDGSTDNTTSLVNDFIASFSVPNRQVRLLSYTPNRGKGYAVRTGMLGAQGDLILLKDADESSPIAELKRLEDALNRGADIAIGSRNKPSTTTTVESLSYRTFIGNTFNSIVQSLLLPGIYDTQCGFKLYRQAAAKEIFSAARLNGYGFDVESLYIAKIYGYCVEEVPTNWHHVEGSKVSVLIDSPLMLLEVLGIAFSAGMGRYKRSKPNFRVTAARQHQDV